MNVPNVRWQPVFISNESAMLLCGLGALALMLGTTVAYVADEDPARQPMLEMCGGLLIIGGLAFVGFALGPFLGRP